VAAATGTTANALLVGFFAAIPVAGRGNPLGPANDIVGSVATACMIPAAVAIGRRLPPRGRLRALHAATLGSLGVWFFHTLIARGVRDAAVINRIVTVFKVIPILVFIVVLFVNFDAGVFSDNWTAYGYGDLGTLNEQVRNTMLITTFVFIGIEGASVYSRYAQRREDVGKATVLGFLSVLSIFALVTLSSYSVVPQPELADTRQPSMIGVFQSVVGDWGKVFISVAVIVSVLGAYLAWTLMAAEVLFVAAQDDDMPRFLKAINPDTDVPGNALLLSAALVQVMLVVTLLSDCSGLTAAGFSGFLPVRRSVALRFSSTRERRSLTAS